jgi:hypothetical protein
VYIKVTIRGGRGEENSDKSKETIKWISGLGVDEIKRLPGSFWWDLKKVKILLAL